MQLNKSLVASLLLLSAVSITVPTLAGDTEKNCGGKHHAAKWAGQDGDARHDFRYMGKALTLTDEQKETLKAQHEDDKSACYARHKKLAEARSALAAAAEAGANDAELNVLADSVGKLHAEQALASAKAKKAFLAVLTEEQKLTFAEAKTKRLERKAERKEARESAKS